MDESCKYHVIMTMYLSFEDGTVDKNSPEYNKRDPFPTSKFPPEDRQIHVYTNDSDYAFEIMSCAAELPGVEAFELIQS